MSTDTGRMPQSQYHTFMDYEGRMDTPGFIVPQEVYRTDAVFQPRAPVQFYNNGQLGIRLSDALASNFSGLADAHEAIVLNEGGVRVAIRILWPGYTRWEKWVSVYGHSSNRPPIMRSQLAHQIAQTIHGFCVAKANEASTETSRDWQIDMNSGIQFERLTLLELRHVSPGSWQPVLTFA